MKKALLVSVGGSPAPVIHTINKQQPDYIIYFASEDSRSVIRQAIEPELESKPIDHEIITTRDVNNLVACVSELLKETPKILSLWGLTLTDLTGDYTGGTKTMSAAVVLALADPGCPYSYVGGVSRDKKGLGVVINGQEKIVNVENPWDVLAVNDLNKIALLFNKCRFKSAEEIAAKNAERTQEHNKFFKNLCSLIQGYSNWDNFKYKPAVKSLNKAQGWFATAAEVNNKAIYKAIAEAVSQNVSHLERVNNDFHWLDKSQAKLAKKPPEQDGRAFVLDILANAVRRGEIEHKYDDAAARLYSTLEKMAKIRLKFNYGLDNSDVDLAKVPDQGLKDELTVMKHSKTGKIQAPLFKSYQILKSLNDDLGLKYQKHADKLRNVIDVRNMSLLAHGYNAVKQETYQDLKKIALDFLEAELKDLPVFPQMDWQGALLS
jgi:CRISPR-associated protein (TIGR02710 family)